MVQTDFAEPNGAQPDDGFSAAVEQAKGVLMESFGVSARQAGELVHGWARQCDCPPDEVADIFIHQVWQGDRTCSDRAVARLLEDALRNLPESGALPVE
ncbi:hypothetical protein Kfla_1147 [Kribbella flavida DSM 17836]|uniref:ANTAR domain-containing protein n=1 Tax=Kribbella flavida (strain DSM 17836 / JCM 10339 / NBRC 14399) TaxID=479435 RepID=D2Q2S0_KRIFD|nr:ANTAR domain-containing protein [Kribbella flavida]ADB30251.1 hypothetical protein Kfla_1147 [Kribbella flavida DSM 17836]